MNSDKKNTRLIWVDLETTGLDPKKDLILEGAVLITDGNLNVLSSYEQVIWQPESRFDLMQPFVFEMHSESGLLHAVKKSSKGLEDFQRKFHGMLYDAGVEPFQGVIAGSTVHFDKAFLVEQIPSLRGFFSHRCFDTSTLKAAHKLWMPCRDILAENEDAKHRAMADVKYSLELARYYKDTLFGAVQKKHDEEQAQAAEPVPMEDRAS